jgi:hypothetical protein
LCQNLALPSMPAMMRVSPENSVCTDISQTWRFLMERPALRRLRPGSRQLGSHCYPTGDWPSGMPSGGPSPALLLGTAGIGYHLLRLHDPARVPPVLL